MHQLNILTKLPYPSIYFPSIAQSQSKVVMLPFQGNNCDKEYKISIIFFKLNTHIHYNQRVRSITHNILVMNDHLTLTNSYSNSLFSNIYAVSATSLKRPCKIDVYATVAVMIVFILKRNAISDVR